MLSVIYRNKCGQTSYKMLLCDRLELHIPEIYHCFCIVYSLSVLPSYVLSGSLQCPLLHWSTTTFIITVTCGLMFVPVLISSSKSSCKPGPSVSCSGLVPTVTCHARKPHSSPDVHASNSYLFFASNCSFLP